MGRFRDFFPLFRTFIFFILGMAILPPFLEVDGIWLIAGFSEILSVILSVIAIYRYRYSYGYNISIENKKIAV